MAGHKTLATSPPNMKANQMSLNLNDSSVTLWYPSYSAMRTPPSVTRACTWVCHAVRKTSTAAPTCRPTCPSREAPKKRSGSPQYSAPPNSHRMVMLTPFHALLHVLSLPIQLNFYFFVCFQWTFWLSWTGRPIQTGCWTSLADYARLAERRLSRSLSSYYRSIDNLLINSVCLLGRKYSQFSKTTNVMWLLILSDITLQF